MGSEMSQQIRVVPPTYAVFSMRVHSKQGLISTLHANNTVVDLITKSINDQFKGGVVKITNPIPPVSIWQLSAEIKKMMWNDEGSFIMFCDLLVQLGGIGWHSMLAADLFISLDESEIVFYKSDDHETATNVLAMHIDGKDKLVIYGIDAALQAKVKTAISQFRAVKDETKSASGKSVTMTIAGNPWLPDNDDGRSLAGCALMEIVKGLQSLGYRFLAPICLDGDQDTVFFGKYKSLESPDLSMITLTAADGMLLQGFPNEMQALLKKVAEREWPKGLKVLKVVDRGNVKPYVYCAFNENPWHSAGADRVTTCRVRLFFMSLLERLAMIGWHLLTSLDLSHEVNDKSAFMFQKGPEIGNRTYIALQPFGTNLLWLIKMPAEERAVIKKALTFLLGADGIEDHETFSDGTDQFQLDRSPWSPKDNNDAVLARHVISVCIAALVARGWLGAAVADLQDDYREVSSTQTIKTKVQNEQKVKGGMFGVGGSTVKNAGQKVQKVTQTAAFSSDLHLIMFYKDM